MAKLIFFLIFCNMNNDIIVAMFGYKFNKHYFEFNQKNGELKYHDMNSMIRIIDYGDSLYHKIIRQFGIRKFLKKLVISLLFCNFIVENQ